MSTNDHIYKEAWRRKLHAIIYEADTPSGKWFDIVLFALIILSVIVVMLESVPSIQAEHGKLFTVVEWFLTIFFTFEYIARILTIKKPRHYVLSFFGIVDLLSILPTYLTILIPGSQSLMVIRTLRLLRIFRVLKLFKFIKEAALMSQALKNSRYKITVFLISVLTIATIMGTIMYLIEPPEAGFTSIPKSIYWAIVTLTTVGFGDIAPTTPLGQFFAAVIMILGYSIIAVPTGIVTNELTKAETPIRSNTQACHNCSREGHDDDAMHCKYCGDHLYPENLDADENDTLEA